MKWSFVLVCMTVLLLLGTNQVHAQVLPYQFYNAKGKPIDFEQVINAGKKADVVCFGELHNDATVHWLQLRLAKAMQQSGRPLSIGYEMFEADQQPVLDSINSGLLNADLLEKHTRIWPNFKTDYAPLVQWAAKARVKQVATNCPRTYARLVNKKGLIALDTLPATAKSYLGPLPFSVDTTLPGYKAMFTMMGGHGQSALQLVHAQALKDNTMAWRIVKYQTPNGIMLHLNGSYHTDNYEGILAYLPAYYKQQNSQTGQIVTVSTVKLDVDQLPKRYQPEPNKKADFYLVLPADAPTSY